MTQSTFMARLFGKFGWLPAALFFGALAVLTFTTTVCVAYMLGQYQDYRESLTKLSRLQERSQPSRGDGIAAPPGSPLLEGETATVASATLVQRVTTAIAAAGGNVVSSEVDQSARQSKEGYLKVTATFEIPQLSLQRLVHDLEAGMPFLFVEQMAVHAPPNSAGMDRLRVRLAISGFWPGGRP